MNKNLFSSFLIKLSEGSYLKNCAVTEKKPKLASCPDKTSFISVLEFSHSAMTQHNFNFLNVYLFIKFIYLTITIFTIILNFSNSLHQERAACVFTSALLLISELALLPPPHPHTVEFVLVYHQE